MKKVLQYVGGGAIALLLGLGAAACGEEKKPQPTALNAPTNVYLSHEISKTNATKYVLKWDGDENAKKYSVKVGNQSYTTGATYYNLTRALEEGETYQIEVTAIGDEKTTLTSQPTVTECTAEELTKGLKYTAYQHKLWGDAVSVSKGTANVGTHLKIADVYADLPVVEIEQNSFSDLNGTQSITGGFLGDGLSTVRLPRDLKIIGALAFSYCMNLQNVTLPDSVTDIGAEAFYGCEKLSSFTIPASVTAIGKNAFQFCSALESISFPDELVTLGAGAVSNCEKLTSVHLPAKLTAIPDYLFADCSALAEIELPAFITAIGIGAFNNCSSLTALSVPDKVTAIGKSAFADCTLLQTVNLPNGITAIPENAFWGCSAMQAFSVPNSVKEIGVSAFYDCKNLKTVSFAAESSLTKIEQSAFENCSALTDFPLSENLTSLGARVFAGCSSLTKMHIPANFSATVTGAFATEFLTELTVDKDNATYKMVEGNLYTKDGETLVQYLSAGKPTTVTLPNGVKKIGAYAFFGAKNLTDVTLPDSVTEIGEHAFENCSALTNVTLSTALTTLGDSAFQGCKTLNNVQLPNGLERVGAKAFYGCNELTEMTLPDSVTYLGEHAFARCQKLTKLTLSKGITRYETNFAPTDFLGFSDCAFTFLEFPDGTTYIGSIFVNSGIREIVIPSSVTSIDANVFKKEQLFELSSIKTVYFKGTLDEALALFARVPASDLKKVTVYIYSETPPPMNEDGTDYEAGFWHYDENGKVVVWSLSSEEN